MKVTNLTKLLLAKYRAIKAKQPEVIWHIPMLVQLHYLRTGERR